MNIDEKVGHYIVTHGQKIRQALEEKGEYLAQFTDDATRDIKTASMGLDRLGIITYEFVSREPLSTMITQEVPFDPEKTGHLSALILASVVDYGRELTDLNEVHDRLLADLPVYLVYNGKVTELMSDSPLTISQLRDGMFYANDPTLQATRSTLERLGSYAGEAVLYLSPKQCEELRVASMKPEDYAKGVFIRMNPKYGDIELISSKYFVYNIKERKVYATGYDDTHRGYLDMEKLIHACIFCAPCPVYPHQ
ncbi:hypothetical protein EalM132_00028 [Exiguobacterium phage vB_EalM-132]|nr:hypothetical protein EalM132_00028 [Exiguobacterium phage vB_EalM-132]